MRCGSQGNQDTAAYTTTPDHIIQSTTQDMVRPSTPANSALSMATEPKAATEDVKIDLFEDDDEFEEFEINEVFLLNNKLTKTLQGLYPPLCICKGKAAYNIPPPYLRIAKSLWAMGYEVFIVSSDEWDDKEEGKEVTQQWEDDWDDDDVSDDFSLQLRRELESNTEKN
ncbi:hypothetical protein D0Y65_010108 [Glycine soja]|uniref:26S proteasome complex subunit SEM1 n=1 Tax=Glycine soja TaxID=3848 RepID=A0A445L1R7_GLYSO|nr:hypothetical protein D0Y65_010108 [Glycine soja]